MSNPRPFRKASIALASCYTRVKRQSLSRAQQSSTKAPWNSLKFFVGNWQGTFQGEPGHGTGERHYQFVLQDKFLQATNKSVYPQQEKNPKGEVHEDLGFFSYDGKRKKFVLRQFHVEGFVNEYAEQEITP